MGKMSVSPKDWETGGKGLLKKEWVIRYRYYNDDAGESKQVWLSDFNRYEVLEERRHQLRGAIEFEINRLVNHGYDPIAKTYVVPLKKHQPGDISKYMPFTGALEYASKRLKVSEETMSHEVKWCLNAITNASIRLRHNEIPIHEINQLHLKPIFEQAALKKDGEFSADKYNRMRKVCIMFYHELFEYKIVDLNIPLAMRKQKGIIKRLPTILTPEQRKAISEYLYDNYRPFWLYLQCFFSVTPRSSEMCRLKVGDVDIANGRVKFLIKKGTHYREAYRPIPDVSLKYWIESVGQAPAEWYLFGRGKKPNTIPIKSYQIHKSWYRHIQEKLGIDITFYKVKHLKLTMLSDELGSEVAAMQGNESIEMIERHYNVNSDKNKEKLLKRFKSEF